MRPDQDLGIVSSPTTTTYQSVEDFVNKYKAPVDQTDSLSLPPVPMAQIGTAPSRLSPIVGKQTYVTNDSKVNTVLPSPQAQFAHLNTAVTGGGAYILDKTQPDALIKLDRNAPEYVSQNNLELARRGLSSMDYQIDHIMPFWAGGTDEWSNKQIIPFSQHDTKTKAQAVIERLYENKDMTLGQARVQLLNWQGRNVDNIPEDTRTLDIATAKKKWEEWNMDPNAGVWARTGEAFKNWGMKQSIKTLIDESTKHFYDVVDETSRNLGPIGVAEQWAFDNTASLINSLPIQATANLFLPKDLEIKPMKTLAEAGVQPVKGFENATDWARLVGQQTGNIAGIYLTLNAIGSALGSASSKIAAFNGSKAATLGSLSPEQLLTPTERFLGKTFSIPKAIPLFKNISFTAGNVLGTSLNMGIYSQLHSREKDTFDQRVGDFVREGLIGALFGTVAPEALTGKESWAKIGAGSAIVTLGTTLISKMSGKNMSESIQDGATMGMMHAIFSADSKLFGANDSINSLDITRKADNVIKSKLYNIGNSMGIKFDINGMTTEEVGNLGEHMINSIKSEAVRGNISPIDESNLITTVTLGTKWSQALKMPEGVEKRDAIKDLLSTVYTIGTNSSVGTKMPEESVAEKEARFRAANKSLQLNGKVNDVIIKPDGTEETVSPNLEPANNTPTGVIGIKGLTAKGDPERTSLVDDFININNSQNRLIKVSLVKAPELGATVASHNDSGVATVDEHPEQQVAIRTDINGVPTTIGTLPPGIKEDVFKGMETAGVEVVPTSIAMVDKEGTFVPDMNTDASGQSFNINLTKENWQDAIIGQSKVDATLSSSNPVLPNVNNRVPLDKMVINSQARKDFLNNAGAGFIMDKSISHYGHMATLGQIMDQILSDPEVFNVTYSKNSDILSPSLVSQIINNPGSLTPADILTPLDRAFITSNFKPSENKISSVESFYDGFNKILTKRQQDAVKGKFVNLFHTSFNDLATRGKSAFTSAVDEALQAEKAIKGQKLLSEKKKAEVSKVEQEISNKISSKPVVLGTVSNKTPVEAMKNRPRVTTNKEIAKVIKTNPIKREMKNIPADIKQQLTTTAMSKEEANTSVKKIQEEQQESKSVQMDLFNFEPKIDNEITQAENNILSTDKAPTGDNLLTHPDDVSDAELKKEIISHNDFYSYNADKIMVFPGKFFEEKIALARAAKDPKKVKALKKEMSLFKEKNIDKMAKEADIEAGGNRKKGMSIFIKNINDILERNGAKGYLTEYNVGEKIPVAIAKAGEYKDTAHMNRAALIKRYKTVLTNVTDRVFSIKGITGSKGFRLSVYDAKLPRAESDLYRYVTDFMKIKENQSMGDLRPISIDMEESKVALEGKNLDFIRDLLSKGVDDIKDSSGQKRKFLFISMPKNDISSSWAIPFDPIGVQRFNADPERYLSSEAAAKYIRKGEVARLDDATKYLYYYFRDIAGFKNDNLDSNVIFGRVQLYHNKQPINFAHQGEKYNLVLLPDKITVGETSGKKIEDIKKMMIGSEEAKNDLIARRSIDGALYMHPEAIQEIGLDNGQVGKTTDLKVTIVDNVINPETGKEEKILLKCHLFAMDKRDMEIKEKQTGRPVGKFDIFANDNNIKFGLEKQFKSLDAGEKPFYEVGINPESMRILWKAPHEPSGSNGANIISKYKADQSIGKVIAEHYGKPTKDNVIFNKLLLAPANGDQIIETLRHYEKQYKRNVMRDFYGPIAASIKSGEGITEANLSIHPVQVKIMQEIQKGKFMSSDVLKIKPDLGYIKGENKEYRYLDREIIIPANSLSNITKGVKRGEIEKSLDGHLIWTKTGDPFLTFSSRAPSSAIDNVTITKTHIAEHNELKSLGKTVAIIDNLNMFGNKNGDSDSDTITVTGVAPRGRAAEFPNMVPYEAAFPLINEKIIVANDTYGAKRPKMELTNDNLQSLSNITWTSAQAVNMVHAVTRTLESYAAAKTRIEVKGDGVTEDRKGYIMFGNKIHKEYLIKEASNRSSDKPLPDTSATVPYTDEDRILAKTLSGLSTDGPKNDGIFNFAKDEQQYSYRKTGEPQVDKDMLFRVFFKEEGKHRVEDPGIMKGIRMIDREFQVIHKISNSNEPSSIMSKFQDAEAPKTDITGQTEQETFSSLQDMHRAFDIVNNLARSIKEGGGTVHPVFRTVEAYDGEVGAPNYSGDKKLQYTSHNRAKTIINNEFPELNIDTPLSLGYQGLPVEKIARLMRLTGLPKGTVIVTKPGYLEVTQTLYSTLKAKPNHNVGVFANFNKIYQDWYVLFRTGSRKYSEEVPSFNPLNKEEWEKAIQSPNQEVFNYPGQKYDDYLNGWKNPISYDSFRHGVAKQARKRMLNELVDITKNEDQDVIDRMVNYLLTGEYANIKQHPDPRYRRMSTEKEEDLIYLYKEVLPSSPAQTEIYHKAFATVLTNDLKDQAMNAGKTLTDFTGDDAAKIKEKYNVIPYDEWRDYFKNKRMSDGSEDENVPVAPDIHQ